MEIATPTTEIIERLTEAGWKVKTTNSGGEWKANGTGPHGDKRTTSAGSEAMALGTLLQHAVRHNYIRTFSTIASIDPNQDYAPGVTTRTARRAADPLAELPRRAARYIGMHDAWWDRSRPQQMNKVEDALRMAKVDLPVDQARRIAEIDLEANGGRGHVFRAFATTQGVTPGDASKVWLLLAPLSSQLALDDGDLRRNMRLASTSTHWQTERAASALRHHLGHDHVPLGLHTACVAELVAEGRTEALTALADAAADMQKAAGSLEGEDMAKVASLLENTEAGFVVVAKIDDAAKRKLRRRLKTDTAREFGRYAALKTKVTKKELEKFLDAEKDSMPHPKFSKFRREALDAFKDFNEAPNLTNIGRGIPGR